MSKPDYYIGGINRIEADYNSIKSLMSSSRCRFFGPPPHKIKSADDFFRGYSTHRMIVRENEGDYFCLGYAKFMHFPIIEALPRDDWMRWLNFHYCPLPNVHISLTNTLFLNSFIYNLDHMPHLLVATLAECFLRERKLTYIAVVQMPDWNWSEQKHIPNYDCLEAYAQVIYPRVFSVSTCKNTQRIYVIHRETILPKMRFRKALPEDNDDIVEVIDMDRPDLREEYGDYFVAEELLKQEDEHDEHNYFIIAEVNLQTIGFIWMNDEVDVMKLIKNFDLESFGNLIKLHNKEETITNRIRVTSVETKPRHKLFTYEAIEDLYDQLDMSKYLFIPSSSSESGSDIASNTDMKELSEHGLRETINEHFTMRKDVLLKLERLNQKLLRSDYYRTNFEKKLRFVINDDGDDDTEVKLYVPDANSNVFALQLFGITQKNDVRCLHWFLGCAFAAFPTRDYCVISIPNSMKITRCLMEAIKISLQVVPRPKSRISDYLYITHRSAIFGEITVEYLCEDDVPLVRLILKMDQMASNQRKSRLSHVSRMTLLSQLSLPPDLQTEEHVTERVMADVLSNPNSEFKFLTIRCGDSLRPAEDNTIVGYCILRQFLETSKLSVYFDPEPAETYRVMQRAEVVLLKLHPLYLHETDTVFREMARKSGFWEFFYMESTEFYKYTLVNDLCTHMQPIEPRRIHPLSRVTYPKLEPDPKALVEPTDYVADTYSLYYNNLKPSRYFGNLETIVILGFTHVCKAFLRLLIFNYTTSKERNCFCCLPNPKIIVIVDPGVVEGDYDDGLQCSQCPDYNDCWVNFRNTNAFISDCIRRIELRKYVQFSSNKVKTLNRAKKTIVLDNDCEVFYNNMVLCSATKYGLPEDFGDTDSPSNYVVINTRLDKIITFHKVLALRTEIKRNIDISIVVFGAHVCAFEFINFLVTHDIPAKNIKLVLPFDPNGKEEHLWLNIPYADLKIEAILSEMVDDLGITIYDGYILHGWTRYKQLDSISHAIFLDYPERNEVSMPCDLFVNFYPRYLSKENATLFEDAGIQMDNNFVLVDDSFRTNDPHIYAIDDYIKPAVLPNNQWMYVAPRERAQKLMGILNLDLRQDLLNEEKYSKPVFYKAQLPMDYFFTKVTLPKRYLAHHLSNEYGNSLTTYDGNFSRVRLNEHSVVEEIVMVTRTPQSLDHLQFFVGKHESLLNDLYARWYLHEIESFVDFFAEPWTELVMHKDFDKLHNTIRVMCETTAQDIVSENMQLERKIRKEMMVERLSENGTTRDVETLLLEFLRKNRVDFHCPFALPEDFVQPT